MKNYLKGLITQNSLPPIYHDTAICLTVIAVAWLFRREIRTLVERLRSHKSRWFGENEFEAIERFSRLQKLQVNNDIRSESWRSQNMGNTCGSIHR